jgi:hypothetical protein
MEIASGLDSVFSAIGEWLRIRIDEKDNDNCRLSDPKTDFGNGLLDIDMNMHFSMYRLPSQSTEALIGLNLRHSLGCAPVLQLFFCIRISN